MFAKVCCRRQMLTMSLLLLLFSILHDVDTNNAAPTLNGNSVRVFKKL